MLRNSTDLNSENSGLLDLKEGFVASDLPIHVDVSDWARIPADFRKEIENAFVVLQKGIDKET